MWALGSFSQTGFFETVTIRCTTEGFVPFVQIVPNSSKVGVPTLGKERVPPSKVRMQLWPRRPSTRELRK
jgi:hypothetical protein